MTSGDVKKMLARPAVERVIDRIRVDENGCWIWTGATYGGGRRPYGAIRMGSRSDGTRRIKSTHVVVWEAVHGPTPAGLELDHLCRVTLCCNFEHLEAVTHQVNLQRMVLSEAEHERRRRWAVRMNAVRWGVAL